MSEGEWKLSAKNILKFYSLEGSEEVNEKRKRFAYDKYAAYIGNIIVDEEEQHRRKWKKKGGEKDKMELKSIINGLKKKESQALAESG